MSRTRWIIFAVICALVLGGLVVLANRNKQDVSTIDATKIIAGNGDMIGDRVYGNKDAAVVVYEYGDFACPGCGSAFPQLKTIKEKYKAQIAFVFRNFPLTSIHPNALAASASAEAAGQQGKYWEMHDQLYENQTSWTSASIESRNGIFEQYASVVGLDLDRYRADLASKAVTDKIARDRALGGKQSVDSTPTLFLGGEKLGQTVIQSVTNGDGSELTKLIDARLKSAGVALPTDS